MANTTTGCLSFRERDREWKKGEGEIEGERKQEACCCDKLCPSAGLFLLTCVFAQLNDVKTDAHSLALGGYA